MLIEDILDLLSLTNAELSRLIGYHRSAVTHWLSGTRNISDDAIYRLYYYLHGKNNQINSELEIIIKGIEND